MFLYIKTNILRGYGIFKNDFAHPREPAIPVMPRTLNTLQAVLRSQQQNVLSSPIFSPHLPVSQCLLGGSCRFTIFCVSNEQTVLRQINYSIFIVVYQAYLHSHDNLFNFILSAILQHNNNKLNSKGKMSSSYFYLRAFI